VTTAKAKAAPAARHSPANTAHPSLQRGRPAGEARGRETRPAGAATSSPTRCARSKFPISRSIRARATAPARFDRQLSRQRDAADLLCLHEESAVAIAHGYAKVTGKAMAAAVHSNVGLFHGHQCGVQRLVRPHPGDHPRRDRAGGRGQAPALDRLNHTAARDQGAIVRDNYTKSGTTQPASPAARPARRSCARAWIANTRADGGAVYINLDAEMQEAKLGRAARSSESTRARCSPGVPAKRSRGARAGAGSPRPLLEAGARTPVILMGPGLTEHGRAGTTGSRWRRRSIAKVITELKIGCRASRPITPLHAVSASSTPLGPRANAMQDPAERGTLIPQPRLGRPRRRLQGHLRGSSRPRPRSISVPSENDFRHFQQRLAAMDIIRACRPVDVLLPV